MRLKILVPFSPLLLRKHSFLSTQLCKLLTKYRQYLYGYITQAYSRLIGYTKVWVRWAEFTPPPTPLSPLFFWGGGSYLSIHLIQLTIILPWHVSVKDMKTGQGRNNFKFKPPNRMLWLYFNPRDILLSLTRIKVTCGWYFRLKMMTLLLSVKKWSTIKPPKQFSKSDIFTHLDRYLPRQHDRKRGRCWCRLRY